MKTFANIQKSVISHLKSSARVAREWLKYAAMLVLFFTLGVGNAWGTNVTGTINFGYGTGSTNVNSASVTGSDSQSNSWTVTTVGTTSFTPNASYAQIGSGNKPATSITFTTTLSSAQTITAFSAKFGGFNGTAGTVTLKVGDTSVGTGSLNAANDVTVSASTTNVSGTVLTVTVTGISKGVKAYYISYTYPGAAETYNVTLNRNGATETINGVTEGTALDDIDGTGAQGGCSEWTFVGWSKTQRAAQNNSTAMTLVTEVDGAGPYYAVYSHTESGGGSSDVVWTASEQGWSNEAAATDKTIDGVTVGNWSKGSNSNAPKYYTSGTAVRAYGGNTFKVSSSSTITKIVLGFGSSDGSNAITTNVGTYSSGTWTGSATSVTFTIGGTSGNRRISSITTTITGGSTTYYSTTASCCTSPGTELSITGSSSVNMGSTLSLETSGGNGGTVTWSVVAGTGAATINSSGVLTPSSAGTVTVKAYQDLNGSVCAQNAEKAVTISLVTPTVTFSNGTYTIGGSALNLSTLFSSNSSGAVTYTITNANGTGASIAGTSFTATTAGTCTVQASQAAYGIYASKTVTATITVQNPAAVTLTLKLPVGDGTFVDYETTDKSKLADYSFMVSEKDCYGSKAFLGGSWNSGYWTDAFIDYDDATSVQPTRYSSSSTFYSAITLYPLFVYGSNPTYYHTDPYCPTYHVTYDGNGKTSGTVPSDATDYGGGETVTVESATLTRTNYTFTGWNTEPDGSGTHYAASGSATFTITEDVTLYAEWCRDLSTLDLNSEFDLEASNILANSARIDWLVADATKYDWALKKGASFDGGTAVSSGSNLAADYKELTGLLAGTQYWFKLTAKNDCGATSKEKTINFTTKAEYVITYHKNDGSGTTATESKTEGVNYTVSSNKFSRDHYTLSKWHTLAVGTGGTDYAKGATYSTDAALDLYAVWEPAVYTVTKTFSGCTSASMPTSYTYTGNANDFSYTVTATSGQTLPSTISITMGGTPLTVGTDYTWNSSTGALAISTVITGNLVITISSMTLYTVTFHNAAGSAPAAVTQTSEGGTVSIPNASACEGWTFVGWKIGGAQSSTTSDPTGSGYITSASWPKTDYVPSGNIDAYAVFRQTVGGGSGAAANTVLWSEDFSGYSANDVPSETISSSDSHTGTTVYSGSVTYACTDGSSGTTKIYNEDVAGGTAPELMVSKYSGTFKITGIPKAGATALTVSFTTNNQNMTVASSTTGYTGSYSQKATGTHSFDIACGSASTFTLTFTGPSGNNNIRLDDIVVKVKTAGASGTTTWTSSPDCGSSKALTSITIDTNPTRLNYVTGESFDPTGAVVTAHYDDSSTETVTGSTTWSPSTALSAGTGQTVTASYTEGGVTKTATITVNVYTPTLLKKDETGTTISGELSDAPAVSLTSVNHLTAAATGAKYTFKEWQISGASLDDASSLTPNIINVTGAVTVTAVYYKPISVTWIVNGSTFSGPSEYARGWNVQYPSNPNPASVSCEGKVFYGWTREENYRSDDTPPTLVASGETLNGDATFYAVFADKEGEGTPPEWTVTSFSSVTAGTYLICCSNKKVFNGNISSGHGQVTSSSFSHALSGKFNEDAPEGSCELTVTTVTNGFKMYNSNYGYLYCNGYNSGYLAWNEGEESEYWYYGGSAWRYHGQKNGSGTYVSITDYGTSIRTLSSSSPTNPIFLKKTAEGSPAVYSDYTTTCTCEGFSFHTGSGTDEAVKTTNTRSCFEQVESGTTWQIENYTIPSDAKFFVGWQDEFVNSLGTSSRSSVQTWAAEMYLENTKTDASTRPTTGPATGAVGTLSIWSDNNWNNCHVGFQPNGYGITYGGSAHAFATTATANKRETEVVTLTNVSQTYNIGLATNTAGTYVKCGNSKETDEALSAMGVTEIVGGQKKILFRPQQYTNDNAKIGLYNVTAGSWVGFMSDDDGDGIYEGFVPTTCTTIIFARHNSSAASPSWDNKYNQTVNIALPTNGLQVIYTFENDWNHKDGEGKHYVSNAAAHPANGQNGKFRMWDNSTDQNWLVHFIPYFHLTYDGNGGGDAVTNLPASPADVNSEGNDAARTVTVANTDPVRSGYRFMGWADTQAHATAGTVDHAKNTTIVMTGDKTIYAVWKQVYTVTYEYDGGSGSCAGGSYIEGEAVTVCASNPTKAGCDFAGWSYSPSVTVSEGAFTMPASNVVITATWTDHSYVLNHNGSNYTNTENQTTIKSGDTPLTLHYTCTGTYGFPNSISISGGGKSWTVGTDYTWTVAADKKSATLVINATTITADVTITITMSTLYTVIWDEHGVTTTEYYSSDDNNVTLKTGIADCGEKKFYGWTEDAAFVSHATTPPNMASSGAINGDKHYYAIYADATVPANPGYVKVTSISAGTYLIATTSQAYTGKYSDKSYGGHVAVTVSDGVINSKPNDAIEVTVTLGTGVNAGKFAIDDGTYWLSSPSSNNLSFAANSGDPVYDWQLGNNGVIYSSAQSRYLQYNASSPRFACYTSGQTDVFLYKKQTTTYENFAKTCAVYDITITTPSGGIVTTTPAAGTGVAGEGQPVTVNVTPNSCKYLSALKYNDGSEDHAISIASTPYTFAMPASDVTVTATFADKTVSSIAPNTDSHRILMQGTVFEGEQIRVTYNNGETEDLAWNASGLTFSGCNMSTLGEQTVNVAYVGSCGNANTSYSIEITDGIPVTFSDCGITTVNKYDPGATVPVKSTLGEYGCSGWAFDGWSETPVVHGSTAGYTIVENFSASVPKTLYAVYVKKENTYTSIDDADELLPGFQYAIMRQYSPNNHIILKAEAGTGDNAGYLVAVNEYDKALSYSSPDHTLTSTEEKYAWQLQGSAGNWALYNKSTNKYLDLSTAGNAEIESTIADRFTITQDAYDNHLFTIRSNTNTTYYLTYNNSYYKSYTSPQKCDILRRSMQFSSTPPCAPQAAIFHGNGGTVIASGGSPTGGDLTIREATRDAGITTPTAEYEDCDGKSWSFIGWADHEVDVTRVPVSTSELLNDGGGNKAHAITTDGEEFWAVYTNQGEAMTKYGTISFNKDDFIGNYLSDEHTVTKTVSGDSYVFGYIRVGHASETGIQFEEVNGEFYNKTSLGKINSISFGSFAAGALSNLNVYVGNAEKATTHLLTIAELQVVDGVSTYYPANDCEYVYIKSAGSYACVTSISIEFGQGTKVWATTPDCKRVTLSGDIYATSTNGRGIMAVTPLRVNAYQLDPSAGIVISSNSSDVYFTEDRTPNFAMAAANQPKNSITLTAGLDGNLTTDIYVHYKPSSAGDGVPADVNVYANLAEPDPGVTATHPIHVRNMPEKFVIAAKVGATWYALPADMNAETNPSGVVIEVDETNMTATAPNTCSYTIWPVKTTNGEYDRYAINTAHYDGNAFGERVRFSAINNGNKGLWANNATSGNGIRNYAAITSTSDGGTTENTNPSYEWIITTTVTDGNWQYTLQTDQTQNNRYLRYWSAASGGPKWGTYASGEQNLYFLPVTEVEPFEMQVVEWYPTKVLIQTEAALASPTVKVNSESVASPVLTNKGGKLWEISGLPLESNPTQTITVSFTADEKNYACSKAIPVILSRSTQNVTAEPFTTLTKDVYNYADLVVRDGAVLTVNGTNAANTFNDVTIYPTSKISVPSDKKLTVHALTFFGGIDEIYDGSAYAINKYGVPELSLKGSLHKSIAQIDYVMRVDLDQMYQTGVPYDVNLNAITYWDGTAMTPGSNLYVSAYDGQARANKESKTWIWEEDFESKLGAATLKAGVGYTISAELQSGVGDTYSIIRMPMATNIANDGTETEKTVPVTAYANTKGETITDNHKGWNYLSNPYMVSISGGEADSKLVVGYLKETGTGPWEWYDDSYRYVTIPIDNGTDYYQQKWTATTLKPFKSFFLQIGTAGDLSFALASRQNMPARYLQAKEREVEFEVLLDNDAQQDHTGFLIADKYTPEYEINADLEKMENAMSVYTILNGYQLAYNALNPNDAKEDIPVGFIANVAGSYTFSLAESGDVEDVEHIWLTDHEIGAGFTTDLIDDTYSFAVEQAGKNNTRFTIRIELKDEAEVPTAIENLGDGDNDRPVKFLYRDKMYILRNGVIYDATGKRVSNN